MTTKHNVTQWKRGDRVLLERHDSGKLNVPCCEIDLATAADLVVALQEALRTAVEEEAQAQVDLYQNKFSPTRGAA